MLASNGFYRWGLRRDSNLTRYSPIVESEGQALSKSSVEDEVEALSRSPTVELLLADPMTIPGLRTSADEHAIEDMMDFQETARLSFEFCFLWVRVKSDE